MSSDRYVTKSSVRATGYTLIALTTVIAGTRFGFSLSRPKKFAWDDGFLIAAFVFFLVVSILYLVATDTMFKLEDVAAGTIKPYPGVEHDGLFVQKIFFVTTSGLWFTLWCVKFSLMALYKRLISGLSFYTKIWWAVIIFCFVVLVGAVTSSMLSCSSMRAWFTAGACSTPRDARVAQISLYYAFAVDVLTDLMIMFLPIGLIWRLQMPLAQKISVGGLFCLGWVCIVVAIIRVRQLGSTVHQSQPKTTWLALWGIVETSIGVIIGCCPGLYTRFKTAQKSRSASSKARAYVNYSGTRGEAGPSLRSRGGEIDLPHYNSKVARTTITARGGPKHWSDAHSSQEELAQEEATQEGEITVTRSVTVGVRERDADSMRDGDINAIENNLWRAPHI